MMALDRLKTLIDAYGADPEHWPADERADALLLLGASEEARTYARSGEALDALLDQLPLRPTVTVDPVAMAMLIARTPARRPAERPRPSPVRGGWSFGFGWPNLAALAAAGIVGFMIGWSDLNNTSVAAGRDILDIAAPVTAVDETIW